VTTIGRIACAACTRFKTSALGIPQ